jgi:hypothetical protein
MSEETKELILNIAMILLCISPMIAISISLYRRKWAPIKSVAAQVIKKTNSRPSQNTLQQEKTQIT